MFCDQGPVQTCPICQSTEITDREKQICSAMSGELRENGIVFAGIDIIGEMLIEVNVTSPTGLQEASRFSGRELNLEIVDRLVDRQ